MTPYAPCPNCQGTNSKQVGFTWWGGVIGPKLLNHVKCQACGTAYNGKSGKSNTNGIIIYSLVAFFIVLGLMLVFAVMAAMR